jgi:hypothetical protein
LWGAQRSPILFVFVIVILQTCSIVQLFNSMFLMVQFDSFQSIVYKRVIIILNYII